MTWKIEDLKKASLDELLEFSMQEVPTLLQMHAIKELATRAIRQPAVLPNALAMIGRHLAFASQIGGLPAGYLGAKVLFDEGGQTRQSLLRFLITAPPLERGDLLRWLQPPSPSISPGAFSQSVEHELIFESSISEEELNTAIRNILKILPSELKVEMLPLGGTPASAGMITLSNKHWDALECLGAQLSAVLNTTVYWLPPEELGALDPDLRIAVHPDGRREPVIARYTAEGFDILPYDEALGWNGQRHVEAIG